MKRTTKKKTTEKADLFFFKGRNSKKKGFFGS